MRFPVAPVYEFLTTSPWPDYALLDSGHFQKLERFGAYVLARPEPQAICRPANQTPAPPVIFALV